MNNSTICSELESAYATYKANPCMDTYKPLLVLFGEAIKGNAEEFALYRKIEQEIVNS